MAARGLDMQTQSRVRGWLTCNMPCSLSVDKCGQALKQFVISNPRRDKKVLGTESQTESTKRYIPVVHMFKLKNVLAVSKGKPTGKRDGRGTCGCCRWQCFQGSRARSRWSRSPNIGTPVLSQHYPLSLHRTRNRWRHTTSVAALLHARHQLMSRYSWLTTCEPHADMHAVMLSDIIATCAVQLMTQ